MKKAAFILVLAMAAAASAANAEKPFRGPFGRTQIVGWVVAADTVSNRILMQTPDGRMRMFVADAAAERRFGSLRVGDEIVLTFDDRVAGDMVTEIEVVRTATRDLLPGSVPIAVMLPRTVAFGAPALRPFAGRTFGTLSELDSAADDVPVAVGAAPLAGVPTVAGGGIALGNLPVGVQDEQALTALGLTAPGGRVLTGPDGAAVVASAPGLTPGFTIGNFTPGTVVPGVTTAAPDALGRPSIANPGFLTPGTVAPGVTITSPASPGNPTVQGNFTPGTIAPGVSATLGNAPPSVARPQGITGSSGAPGGLTIANPGALPPPPPIVTPQGALTPGAPGGTVQTGTVGGGQGAPPATAAPGTPTAGQPPVAQPPTRDQGASRSGTTTTTQPNPGRAGSRPATPTGNTPSSQGGRGGIGTGTSRGTGGSAGGTSGGTSSSGSGGVR